MPPNLTKIKFSQKSDSSLNLCSNELVQNILKCFFCEKFLSVPPIFSNDHESICGRCKFVDRAEDSKWSRQIVYESVAQHMIFPCSNSTYGCKAELKWDEVEEHENTCLYKKLTCPFANSDLFKTDKCKWTGSGPGLNEHLENYHAELVKKLPEINFTEARTNMIFLARILKQLMIITIMYENPGRYSCLVMVNGTSTECESYRYQLELYDEQRKNSLILRRSRLEDAVSFEENLINSEKMLVFDLPVISDLLKRPSAILGRFGIIKKSKKEICYGDKGLNSSQQEGVLDESFLRELECPVCKNYMVPPIRICSTGHSFCSKCKDQMDECPTCRHPFREGRNYTLEKIAASLSYPCMFKEAGCFVTCSSEKLREHEQECSFSGTQCFLSCAGGPVVNMFKHLIDKHQECMIVSEDLHILDVGDEGWKYFAMCFGNDIFKLTVAINDDWIKFALHQFGVKQSNYTYELEIICSTECSEKICITKECVPLNGSDPLHKCISISGDMMEKFISEEDLIFFKVHLKKNI